jgi:propionyl-CoA synthetase
MTNRYDEVRSRSVDDPEGFWAEAAEEIHWYKKWHKVLDDSNKPLYRWFVGGEVNTCYNAVDRHIANGRGEQVALIYDSPVTDTIKTFTFYALREEIAKCAGALAALGVSKGDRVVVYMPMIPEAMIAMLAVARLGAIHSVVFGGFASHELAMRIDDAKPKLVIPASCGIEPGRLVAYKPLLDAAIEMARHKPQRCIVYQRPIERVAQMQGRDLDWNEVMAGATPHGRAGGCNGPAHPLYLRHDRPTEGDQRDNGTTWLPSTGR